MNDTYYDTYDDIDDSFVDRYIEKQRDDFDHQWRVYTSDDTITYDQADCLKNLLRMDSFF